MAHTGTGKVDEEHFSAVDFESSSMTLSLSKELSEKGHLGVKCISLKCFFRVGMVLP